jgi:2-isopropylmalate synthase
MPAQRLYLYDTTLRDGAQTRGVDFSVKDKATIAGWLDKLGIAYIEGGWPGANPTDDAFFASPPALKTAKLTAFGMTRKPGNAADNDPGLQALLNSPATAVCLVGKCWDVHVTGALGVTLDENLDLIRSSLSHIVSRKKEALFDAEHFFDGFKANAPYALSCLKAAQEAGAKWLVLCDTNGGTLPHEVEAIVREVIAALPNANFGIHVHNDTGNAIANSLAGARAGCRMIQGTINGLGERCGNADLIALIPTLTQKLGFDVGIKGEKLKGLTALSRAFDALLDRDPVSSAPYVGASAFAHKGGLHASAVAKNPRFYEHADPNSVGNQREILMSNQAGQSNVRAQLQALDIDVADNDPRLPALLASVKQREHEGYSYDNAAGSFAVLALRALGRLPVYFTLQDFSVHDAGRFDANGQLLLETKASLSLRVGDDTVTRVAIGNGPVNALDRALREALINYYPALANVKLTDYHVRILDTGAATGAKTRVLLESEDEVSKTSWTTTGVSTDIIGASLQALLDSYILQLSRLTNGRPHA